MSKFIEVKAVAGVEQPNNVVPFGSAAVVNDELERDDMDEAQAEQQPREIFLATRINIETIRSYNVRKGNRVGTRIVFINGTALPVGDLIDEIDTKIDNLPQ